jgi:phage repressor protein C with HTH and peptisase S24 domain
MLTHPQVWAAIDALAAAHGMSPSGLARRAGLDATTFNKSKRSSAGGRLRWPSTESISKVLEATGTGLEEFLGLVQANAPTKRATVPLIGFAQAGSGGYFDDAGFPVGAGWDEVAFPDGAGPHAYALEVSGDSMMPVYRDGDILIVAPNTAVRRGDRVVVKTTEGEVLAKELRRQTAKTIELKSLNPEHEDRVLPLEQVTWVARIMWSSQ